MYVKSLVANVQRKISMNMRKLRDDCQLPPSPRRTFSIRPKRLNTCICPIRHFYSLKLGPQFEFQIQTLTQAEYFAVMFSFITNMLFFLVPHMYIAFSSFLYLMKQNLFLILHLYLCFRKNIDKS